VAGIGAGKIQPEADAGCGLFTIGCKAKWQSDQQR